MKISNREKLLLGILILAVLSYLFYNFVYVRNEEKILELEAELELKNTQVEELMRAINNEKQLNSQFKELNFEISDMSKMYLPDLEQEKLIVFMDDKLEEYNIDTNNISFNLSSVVNHNTGNESQNDAYRYRLEELYDNYYNIQKSEDETTQENEPQTASADYLRYNINFSSDYYDLLDFIDDLQKNQFEVTLSSMTLTLAQNAETENLDIVETEENLMSGTMMMDIYSIPKLHEHEYMNWVWADYIESGRSNPFYESDVQRDQYWTTRYDFIMNVKPISSDLPTVTLGEEDDIARDSYVYADSNSVESLDIEVMQDGEVYYYKYRTSMQTYPSNYEEEWIEFVPENEYISMQINSEPRNGADDESGVELNIVNDTDIIFYINILNEDLINPRVEYEESGNVVFRVNE